MLLAEKTESFIKENNNEVYYPLHPWLFVNGGKKVENERRQELEMHRKFMGLRCIKVSSVWLCDRWLHV